MHYVVGDHATDDGRRLLSPDHLRELVPDIGERDVFVCGPPAMTDGHRTERPWRARAAPSHPHRTLRPHLRRTTNAQNHPRRNQYRRARLPRADAATPLGDRPPTVPKKKVVTSTKAFTGSPPTPTAGGAVKVTLVVKKTTTIIGTKKKVARKIIGVTRAPVSEPHRPLDLHQPAGAALPDPGDAAGAELERIYIVSGATDTSDAFVQSLQSAILQAKAV